MNRYQLFQAIYLGGGEWHAWTFAAWTEAQALEFAEAFIRRLRRQGWTDARLSNLHTAPRQRMQFTLPSLC